MIRIITISTTLLVIVVILILVWLSRGESVIGAVNAPEGYVLESETLKLEVSPRLGGRIVHFGLQGRSNVLRVSEDVVHQPDPLATPQADNIGYLGHEVWLGPQSQWWSQQTLNPERRAAAADWPPDPFLSYAPTQVVEQDERQLILEGTPSPVSGIQLRQHFQLSGNPQALLLAVQARNVRETPVSWDIWFNTRVAPSVYAYVPVGQAADIRVQPFPDEQTGPVDYQLENGLMTLDLQTPEPGHTGRRGKLFIQPSAGWMAAFAADQVFIIQFEHHPITEIHPEQGQVEWYVDWRPDAPEEGLLELEVHAPYRTLAPGETMSAWERWSLWPYAGEHRPEAHREWLEQNGFIIPTVR